MGTNDFHVNFPEQGRDEMAECPRPLPYNAFVIWEFHRVNFNLVASKKI